ncbi:MAG TPA: hypothetical protein VHV82_19750 [Sporichthyaceae bacterium]|jgi:hypothetical protein|nr:hypothetical protein [Sporichthyaceae bacterium]
MTTRERLQELAEQICWSIQHSQRPAEPPVRGCPAFVGSVPGARATDRGGPILRADPAHRVA